MLDSSRNPTTVNEAGNQGSSSENVLVLAEGSTLQ